MYFLHAHDESGSNARHSHLGVPKSHQNKKSQDWDFLGENPKDFLGFFGIFQNKSEMIEKAQIINILYLFT